MDRRVFLKATGAGLVKPAGLLTLGPAVVRQGNRGLKDITADELMELLAWAKIDAEGRYDCRRHAAGTRPTPCQPAPAILVRVLRGKA